MNRDLDQIRNQIRKVIKLRERYENGSQQWSIIQSHLNTLLWAAGAIDIPVDEMLENYLQKFS